MLSSDQMRKLKLAVEHVRGVFTSASLLLTIGVGACLFIMLLNAIWWEHLPEPFEGANNLIKIVMDLFAAIVASYIFYLIIDVSPKYKKKRTIYFTIVRSGISSIANMHRDVINQIMEIKDRPHAFESIAEFALNGFREKMDYKVKNIKLGDRSPFISPENKIMMTWLELFERNSLIEDECLDYMFKYKEVLDTTFDLLLNGLLNSEFKTLVNLYSSMPDASNLPMEKIITPLYQHIQIINVIILQYEIELKRMNIQLERTWECN